MLRPALLVPVCCAVLAAQPAVPFCQVAGAPNPRFEAELDAAASAGLAASTSTRDARAEPGKDPGPCAPGSAAAAQARSKSAVGRPIPRI